MARKQPDGEVYDPNEGLGVRHQPGPAAGGAPAGGCPRRSRPAGQRYLFAQQNGEAGSPGQGGKGSKDLSNTGYALQALRASGVPAQDAHLQAALAFLQRCQDLSAVNPAPWAKNSGGEVYGPQEAARSWESGDESQSPRWTPSGTMIDELISSYLLLDLAHDDPRVQAAVAWLRRNYGFAANPSMRPGRGRQGLYHLHALAGTALGLASAPAFPLPSGGSANLFAVVAAEAQHAPLPGGGEGLPTSAPPTPCAHSRPSPARRPDRGQKRMLPTSPASPTAVPNNSLDQPSWRTATPCRHCRALGSDDV